MEPSSGDVTDAARALRLLEPLFLLERSNPEGAARAWPEGSLWSVTRTDREVSVIREADPGREPVPAESAWRCLEVQGPIPHDAVGVLAALAAVLRDAGVPILALSTYDTDYLFVPATRTSDAVAALRAASHAVAVPAGAPVAEEATE